MLRKINFKELSEKAKGLFKKKEQPKTTVKAQPAKQAAPVKQTAKNPSLSEVPPDVSISRMIPEKDIYSENTQPPTLKIKEEDFFAESSPDFLKPMVENEAIEIQPLGADEKKIKRNRSIGFFSQIFRDLFSGIVIALCAIAAGMLLAESYTVKEAPYYAWLAFIPFAIAIFNIKSAFFSFIFGWLTGGIFYFISLNWISSLVAQATGDQNLAMTALTSLSALLALQFAFFSLGSYYLRRIPMLWPLATACLWVGLEIAHQFIASHLLGFPWFVLGYTQFSYTWLIQISSFTGVYGVSFILIFTSLSIGFIFTSVNNVLKGLYFILTCCFLSIVLCFGYKEVKEQLNYMQSAPNTLRVALMQPNTHQMLVEGRDEDAVFTIAGQLEALKGKKASFVIWPESSLPGNLLQEEYTEFIQQQNAELKTWQLFGGTEEVEGTEYVAAVLTNEQGIADDYKKTQLVPYGEFLPFKTLLGWFYKRHDISSLTGTFAKGEEPAKTLSITVAPLPDKSKKNKNKEKEEPQEKTFTFGTEICFESVFPSVYRAQAANGADFFVNISNDGWFGESAAPYQHLRANIFRAVENRRPLLRSTNTGISAWIDSLGKIHFQTGLNKEESSVFDFVFKDRDVKTFYTTHGDLFSYICLVIAVSLTIVSIVFCSNKDPYGN